MISIREQHDLTSHYWWSSDNQLISCLPVPVSASFSTVNLPFSFVFNKYFVGSYFEPWFLLFIKLSTCSLAYWYQHGLTDASSIQQFIFHYNHNLLRCSNCPSFVQWEPLRLCSVSSDMSPSFIGHITTFWHNAVFQDYLYFLCPISGASSGILLSGEWHLVSKI